MSFLSVVGKIIIGLTVISFFIGMWEALVLGSLLVAGLAVLGLIGGVYVGSLGVKVDEINEIATISHTLRRVEQLEEKVKALEKEKSITSD